MDLVTCRICKKKINKETAYVVTSFGEKKRKTNLYYCSEKELDAYEEKLEKENQKKALAKKEKDDVYDFLCNIFGYKVINTTLFNEWNKWKTLKPNSIILEYLKERQDYLTQVCQRDFKNEGQKIMYFSAILKNSLHDFRPVENTSARPKVQIDETIYSVSPKNTNKRRSVADLEDDA